MLFEQNILGQPQRGETQAVPAVFHLTCAQEAPSLGTAVGRGWQRTTVPPGQAPLVGLEQGVTQGQNHMYHLSSCKPTNYPCRKKQTGNKKKKNQPKQTNKKTHNNMTSDLRRDLGTMTGQEEAGAGGFRI